MTSMDAAKVFDKFRCTHKEGRVPGLGPRPLTPIFWLQVARARLRQDGGGGRGFLAPQGLHVT